MKQKGNIQEFKTILVATAKELEVELFGRGEISIRGRISTMSRNIEPLECSGSKIKGVTNELAVLCKRTTGVSYFYESVCAAIDRIKNGTYGYCIECRKKIGIKRLKAVPHTLFCRPCCEKQ